AVSSCNAIKPASGFDPTKFLKLVRNPNYDATTDSPSVRSNNIDGFLALIDSNTDDIFNKVETGELDGSWTSQPPPQVLQKYATDSSLRPFFHSDSGDRTWYITMNHVRSPESEWKNGRSDESVAYFWRTCGGGWLVHEPSSSPVSTLLKMSSVFESIRARNPSMLFDRTEGESVVAS